MKEKIFVSGSTGNIGSQVMHCLLTEGVAVVGKKSFRFDFTDRSTWSDYLDGVTRVFLMRPPHISNIKRDMLPFLKHLKEIEIKQVLFLSVQGAENNKLIPHHKVEKYCMELDLPYTFIRPSFFMQNLTTTHLSEIRDEKMVFVPSGEGKTNFIDARDIGEIAAKLLLSDEHIEKAYTITGEQSYSHGEIARHLTEELGVEIRFISPNPFHFVLYHLRKGKKLSMALVMLALYSVVKLGNGDVSTDDSEAILQRKTRSLEDFIRDYRSLFLGISSE